MKKFKFRVMQYGSQIDTGIVLAATESALKNKIVTQIVTPYNLTPEEIKDTGFSVETEEVA